MGEYPGDVGEYPGDVSEYTEGPGLLGGGDSDARGRLGGEGGDGFLRTRRGGFGVMPLEAALMCSSSSLTDTT